MKNEKTVIFGDSYSTYEGYVPEGYAIYYPRKEIESVDDVSKTWWHMLLSETNSEIVLNNSWSGSTICNRGYNGDCSKSSSFIHRLEVLTEEGFFEKNEIDRVFVFGGTNDSWVKMACGEIKFSDWSAEDLHLVLPGICFFIHKLLEVVPKEKVHIIINTQLRQEITDGFLDICKHYGLNYTLLSDIEKQEGHPNYNGMTQIKNQVLASIK